MTEDSIDNPNLLIWVYFGCLVLYLDVAYPESDELGPHARPAGARGPIDCAKGLCFAMQNIPLPTPTPDSYPVHTHPSCVRVRNLGIRYE